MTYSTEQSNPAYRSLNLFGFLICALAVAFAVLYLQGNLGLEPCPLCSAVRLAVLAQALLFLLAFLHNPKQLGQRTYASLGFIITLAGIGISIRHVWLQSLPADEVPECGPGLEYLLNAFPLQDAIKLVLSGSGECADVQWQLFGLTIPQQSLVLFALLSFILLTQFKKKRVRSYFS